MPETDPSKLFEGYLARLQAGETIERLELEEQHPGQAAELWRRVVTWRDVARALPCVGPPETGSAGDDRELAIRFHSAGGAEMVEDLMGGAPEPAELARRIAERGESIGRYQVVDEIARGAMGAILGVIDKDLGRELAMKVMLARQQIGASRACSAGAVARFVEEARITGRLEHPGVPAVHDFGVDPEGNFYFTMPWVRGHTLREVFRRVRQGEAGWTRARALGLLMQVCDALAYAHDKGIVHRDLKPRNVMVGEFGEVYVMDWGLARDVSRAETADLRLVTPENDDGSPVVTRDGAVIGTPCYMSPEQARGDVSSIGPRTDVYALGAILYELLAEHPPYAPRGSRTPAYGVVRQVQSGPPVPVLLEGRDVPGELVAICERAMEREPEARFADVGELAQELRAFLEGRVVASYATGAWIELRKWAGRNPVVAALVGLLVVVLLISAVMLRAADRTHRSILQRELDGHVAESLLETADDLPRFGADGIQRMQAWIAEAEDLASREPEYSHAYWGFVGRHSSAPTEPNPDARPPFDNKLIEYGEYKVSAWRKAASLRQTRLDEGLSPTEAGQTRRELDILSHELAVLGPQLLQLNREWSSHRSERLAEPALEREFGTLLKVHQDLQRIVQPDSGALARVRERLELARQVGHLSLEQHAETWDAALASIADRAQCPLYDGLQLELQLGLVPLGRNAAGLWEFWHLPSGERPEELAPGEYELRTESGLVFVLVPGGDYQVGAQFEEPEGPQYCPPSLFENEYLMRDEGPVRTVTFAPYFLSKYEMTQAQWVRLSGSNPSKRYAGTGFTGQPMVSAVHPVEHVSWEESSRVLPRWGLDLPTESQWEVAARAGTDTHFLWGTTWPPPRGQVVFDERLLSATDQAAWGMGDDWEASTPLHAPVGGRVPNSWGFHDVAGNVAEWSRDWFTSDCYGKRVIEGTGEVVPDFSSTRTFRGGSYMSGRSGLRASRRPASRPEKPEEDVGVRPVLRVFE